MLLALATAAFADSLVLDNGATLSGSLAAYERGGSCTISVQEGDLSGADVVLPCSRIARFEHDPDANPVLPPTAEVEEVPLPDVLPVDVIGATYRE